LEHCFRIVRLELDGAAEMRRRLVETIEFAQCGTKIVVRLMVRRPQCQHATIARLCLGGAPRVAQQIAELVVRLDEFGIAFDRLAERGFGLCRTIQRPENGAERGTAIGPGRRERHRPLDVRGRRLRASGAERQDTEQMPSPGMHLVLR
jgi:hypothetical protein